MHRMTETRSAAGVGDSIPPDDPDEYQRTSTRARTLGYTVTPTETEGFPAFLVGKAGRACLLPDLAAVDSFLNRAVACEPDCATRAATRTATRTEERAATRTEARKGNTL